MSAVNLPNSITLTRIFSIPVLIWILSTSRFHGTGGEKELLASALFIAASITDGIDGYLARKRGQITTIGMVLDPLADKLLIAAAFVTLVQFNPSLVPAWVAVVIIAREFLVSGLRSIAASEGFTIEASDLGKFKMLVQIVSVVAVILDHRWKAWYVGRYIFPVHWIAFLAIWFMVFLSLVSAVDYFAAFWSKIDRRVVKRRRRAFVLSPWWKPPGQRRLKIPVSGRSLPTKLRNWKFPSVFFLSSRPFEPRRSKSAGTASLSAWRVIAAYCCPRSRPSTDGIASLSSNKPARKRACR